MHIFSFFYVNERRHKYTNIFSYSDKSIIIKILFFKYCVRKEKCSIHNSKHILCLKKYICVYTIIGSGYIRSCLLTIHSNKSKVIFKKISVQVGCEIPSDRYHPHPPKKHKYFWHIYMNSLSSCDFVFSLSPVRITYVLKNIQQSEFTK